MENYYLIEVYEYSDITFYYILLLWKGIVKQFRNRLCRDSIQRVYLVDNLIKHTHSILKSLIFFKL